MHFIKIEIYKHPQKANSINEEIEIIKELNYLKCVCCPKIVKTGMLKNGKQYFIQERIHKSKKSFSIDDLLVACFELYFLGYSHNDINKHNIVYNGRQLYLVDYDQAKRIENKLIKNANEAFEDIVSQIGNVLIKNEIFKLKDKVIVDSKLNLTNISLLRKQKTTMENNGYYHKIENRIIKIDGSRGLGERMDALDKISFISKEKVLDIGCNLGLLAHYLFDRGCDVVGVDMDDNVVKAAQIVANISQKDIYFKKCDLEKEVFSGYYDSIFMFSVLHHIKRYKYIAKYIAQNTNRIFIECRLNEVGMRPTIFGWGKSGCWNFSNEKELIVFLEKIFCNFKLASKLLSGDRERNIYEFKKNE